MSTETPGPTLSQPEAGQSARSVFADPVAAIRSRLEFGDVLLLLYFVAFIRQYLWLVTNNSLAWIGALLLTAPAWYFYVSTKQFAKMKYGRRFWILVGIPLLAAYVLHAAFPDRSYDVLNYHLLHAERSLRGPLFMPSDYFPSPIAFNPIGDTLTGTSRLLLGFRLGTVINLLVLIWAAQLTDKILRPLVSNAWLRSLCVLLAVSSEQFIFEISTYMIDLLALPLMFEATLLTLRWDEAESKTANLFHIALLLGASTAFKLTNLAVALPLFTVCVYKTIAGPERTRPKISTKRALVGLLGFIAPLLPFSIFIFRLTGNPIFPVANSFFKSPYWPTHGGWDSRFGPNTLWQTMIWPVLVWFRPERSSELAVYSGRLCLGFMIAIVGLLLVWRNARVRTLCFLLLTSSLLWSAAAIGYSRYGFYQELLAGVTVVAVVSVLFKRSGSQLNWSTALGSFICLVLAAQTVLAGRYALHKDWGGRLSIVDDPSGYSAEAKLILRDHNLRDFFTDDQRALFDRVQVWVETCPKSTGFEVLLNTRAPVIAARQPEYFVTRESWRQFIRVVEQSPGQRMFSLCLNDEVTKAKQVIAERGLEVSQLTPVNIPFFSPRDQIGMMLIEVRVPQEPEARSEFETAWMKGAFPTSVYREEIVALDPPSVMHTSEKVDIRFRVRNLGNGAWPAVGTKDFRYQVNMGDRWIADGAKVEDNRAVMKGDLAPGAETQMTLTVNAPRTPGEYTLEIDMVHEGVTWFSERGARPLRLSVRVAP
jgi:hypothetical protein